MTNFTNNPQRRLALKALGSSALIGGLADKLPDCWQRPFINAAVSPAQAQTWHRPIVATAVLPDHAQASAVSIRAPAPPLVFAIADIQTRGANTAEAMVGLYHTGNGQVVSVEIGDPDAARSPASARPGRPSPARAQTDAAAGLRLPAQRFVFPEGADRIRGDLQLSYNNHSAAYSRRYILQHPL